MKPVNPIHFFDERGHSIASNDHLQKRVSVLEAQNERLKRLLKAQLRRNKLSMDEPMEISTRH